ncbi:hypothetical protein GCM10010912_19880 [Paenibacillus albidus]|uniref:Uncharacterized protein n=1 Tax=Paenibacillus albidus TaxID=2041023 RepID=A0A917FE47_9BACL|nr:hypothetical protein [Paenibacillus albidus]GGF74669.1 hypothetical protein GCM10010912_19880 [Paenibacillus albidus]
MVGVLRFALAAALLLSPNTVFLDSASPERSSLSEVSILESQVINTHHTGGAFQNEFTLAPSNGSSLKVWMQNNSNVSVQFQVTRNGSVYFDVPVAARSQEPISFEDQLGIGLTGTYKVYIYSTNGTSLDINVSARQF